MDSDSEGQKNQGVLVGKEGAVMIDIILATLVGLLAVIIMTIIPLVILHVIFRQVTMEWDTEDINNNNQEENGNN